MDEIIIELPGTSTARSAARVVLAARRSDRVTLVYVALAALVAILVLLLPVPPTTVGVVLGLVVLVLGGAAAWPYLRSYRLARRVARGGPVRVGLSKEGVRYYLGITDVRLPWTDYRVVYGHSALVMSRGGQRSLVISKERLLEEQALQVMVWAEAARRALPKPAGLYATDPAAADDDARARPSSPRTQAEVEGVAESPDGTLAVRGWLTSSRAAEITRGLVRPAVHRAFAVALALTVAPAAIVIVRAVATGGAVDPFTVAFVLVIGGLGAVYRAYVAAGRRRLVARLGGHPLEWRFSPEGVVTTSVGGQVFTDWRMVSGAMLQGEMLVLRLRGTGRVSGYLVAPLDREQRARVFGWLESGARLRLHRNR